MNASFERRSPFETSFFLAGHNPALHYAPFALEENPAFLNKAPNELRVALSQARELAMGDLNLLSKGGSSDPFARFQRFYRHWCLISGSETLEWTSTL